MAEKVILIVINWVVAFISGLSTGYVAEKYGLLSAPCMMLVVLLSITLLMQAKLIGVALICPAVSCPIVLGTFVLGVFDWGIEALLRTHLDYSSCRAVLEFWALAQLWFVRGVGLFPASLSTFVRAYQSFLSGATPSVVLADGISVTVCAFYICCAYLADQRMLTMVTPILVIRAGGEAALSNQALANTIIGKLPFFTFCIWICLLFLRRRRSIPAGIQEAKFISVRYLRKMLATGIRITRCQDLPDEAYGDIGKADQLLIASHRWLDRYSCDIATVEFPVGLRLATMVRALGNKFPTTLQEVFSGSKGNAVKLLWKAMTSQGDDILLFFDFMALPQIGKRPDGTLIERTEAESALFQKALPEMGALYTTYPVIVLPEVVPDIAPYFCSAWCFCEFIEAVLCKTIGEYSPEVPKLYEQWSEEQTEPSALDLELLNKGITTTFTTSLATEFRHAFLTDLKQKRLVNEGDREVIRAIVHGFLLRRLLCDAIARQDPSDVQHYIAEVCANGLVAALSHPIDDNLNTLLHKAVGWWGSKEIVAALIAAGADVTAKNLRGDVPSQFLIFPLLSPAASICREAAASRLSINGYSKL